MEKLFIIKFPDDLNLLKKISKLVSKYRHRNKLLLCIVKRNDNMDRCLLLYFVFIFFFVFCLHLDKVQKICI